MIIEIIIYTIVFIPVWLPLLLAIINIRLNNYIFNSLGQNKYENYSKFRYKQIEESVVKRDGSTYSGSSFSIPITKGLRFNFGKYKSNSNPDKVVTNITARGNIIMFADKLELSDGSNSSRIIKYSEIKRSIFDKRSVKLILSSNESIHLKLSRKAVFELLIRLR